MRSSRDKVEGKGRNLEAVGCLYEGMPPFPIPSLFADPSERSNERWKAAICSTQKASCLAYTPRSQSIAERSQGGVSRSRKRGGMLLVGCLWTHTWPAFLYSPGPPALGWYRPQHADPSLINHQSRQLLKDMARGQGDLS